jgi:type II secretory pathway predicted ATPase ExeA
VKHKIHALFGLKWNPFLPDVPTEALHQGARLRSFRERVERLAEAGGFALLTGEPGCGKSAALRVVHQGLSQIPDVTASVLTRPQASVFDFYRELGELFGVQLSPCNRFGGTKVLRDRWLEHVERTGVCPALIVDEAQEMRADVLNEIRLLSSFLLDSRLLLVVVLAGDPRLLEHLRQPELLALHSRIRVRLVLPALESAELEEVLAHLSKQAGNAQLLTKEVARALCDHAAGNLRALMNMAAELLEAGVRSEAARLDEKLFLELYGELEGVPAAGRKRVR